MTKPSLEALAERLELLEREKRQLRWAAAVFLVVAIGVVLPRSTWFRGAKVVEAEKLVLRDKQGHIRAQLSTAPDGSPSLALLNKDGQAQLTLEGSSDDSASLHLSDRGQVRVALASDATGAASLNFFDPLNRSNGVMYLRPDGTTGLGLHSGPSKVQLTAAPGQAPQVSVKSPDESSLSASQVAAPAPAPQPAAPVRAASSSGSARPSPVASRPASSLSVSHPSLPPGLQMLTPASQ